MNDRAAVSRGFFLAVVVVTALAAVLVREEATASFLAGFAAGTGLVFVASFLRNPRKDPGPGGESS